MGMKATYYLALHDKRLVQSRSNISNLQGHIHRHKDGWSCCSEMTCNLNSQMDHLRVLLCFASSRYLPRRSSLCRFFASCSSFAFCASYTFFFSWSFNFCFFNCNQTHAKLAASQYDSLTAVDKRLLIQTYSDWEFEWGLIEISGKQSKNNVGSDKQVPIQVEEIIGIPSGS